MLPTELSAKYELCGTLGTGAMGRVYGMVLTAAGTGSALGSWAGGALFDLTGGYHAGLALSALGALGGLALFWTVPALRGDGRPGSTSSSTPS